jgi:hypothetical protein
MTEHDWQPIKIASHRTNSIYHGREGTHENLWIKYQGAIVRVRPSISKVKSDYCDGNQWYEIHPDDCPKIEALSGMLLCEHQILAD